MATYVYGNGGAMPNPNVTVDNLPIKKDMYASTRECNIYEETLNSQEDSIVRYWETENAMIYAYRSGYMEITFLENNQKQTFLLHHIECDTEDYSETLDNAGNKIEETIESRQAYPFSNIGDIIINNQYIYILGFDTHYNNRFGLKQEKNVYLDCYILQLNKNDILNGNTSSIIRIESVTSLFESVPIAYHPTVKCYNSLINWNSDYEFSIFLPIFYLTGTFGYLPHSYYKLAQIDLKLYSNANPYINEVIYKKGYFISGNTEHEVEFRGISYNIINQKIYCNSRQYVSGYITEITEIDYINHTEPISHYIPTYQLNDTKTLTALELYENMYINQDGIFSYYYDNKSKELTILKLSTNNWKWGLYDIITNVTSVLRANSWNSCIFYIQDWQEEDGTQHYSILYNNDPIYSDWCTYGSFVLMPLSTINFKHQFINSNILGEIGIAYYNDAYKMLIKYNEPVYSIFE